MAIYHKWKCILVHIPKTAGSSIHSRLINRTDPESNHKTFFELLNENDAELFESYHSFSVVRNPYDRFISAFEYARTVTGEIENNTVFDKFVQQLNEYSTSFYSYVPLYFMPQYQFITIKNVLLVDELLRYETISEDWKKLANKLNDFKTKRNNSVGAINYANINPKLETLNVTTARLNKNINDYFTDKNSKEIIYNLYKKDFEIFEYEK